MGKLINENSLKNFIKEKIDRETGKKFEALDKNYEKLWNHIAKMQEDIQVILAKLKEMGEKK